MDCVLAVAITQGISNRVRILWDKRQLCTEDEEGKQREGPMPGQQSARQSSPYERGQRRAHRQARTKGDQRAHL